MKTHPQVPAITTGKVASFRSSAVQFMSIGLGNDRSSALIMSASSSALILPRRLPFLCTRIQRVPAVQDLCNVRKYAMPWARPSAESWPWSRDHGSVPNVLFLLVKLPGALRSLRTDEQTFLVSRMASPADRSMCIFVDTPSLHLTIPPSLLALLHATVSLFSGRYIFPNLGSQFPSCDWR